MLVNVSAALHTSCDVRGCFASSAEIDVDPLEI